MEAGKEADCKSCEREQRDFPIVLEELIQKELTGVIPGITAKLRLSTDEELMDEKNGILRMRRRQSRPKIKPVDGVRLAALLGRPPEAGEVIEADKPGAIPFTVLNVQPPPTLIEYNVHENQLVQTPFGPAKVETVGEKNFWIFITPEKDFLVRSGGLIGRVVDIDDTHITLDYRNPFGYEQLDCEVDVVDVLGPEEGRGSSVANFSTTNDQ